jgi:hypothetical protein
MLGFRKKPDNRMVTDNTNKVRKGTLTTLQQNTKNETNVNGKKKTTI